MRDSSWHSVDGAARNLTPSLLTLLLVLFGQLPFALPGQMAVTPYFVLMAVYYWGLHRSDLLPATVVFLIGLLQDALEGEPFGVNAFVLVAVYWFVASQQRLFRGKHFVVVWWGFAIAALLAALARWILVSILLGMALAPWGLALEFLVTVALYPVLTVAFTLAHKTLPRSDLGEFLD